MSVALFKNNDAIAGSVIRTYTYGPGVDDIQSMTTYEGNEGPKTYYYIKDASNTVHVLVDEDGLIVEYYYYDAFGNVKMRDENYQWMTESNYGNRFLFQGREYDYATQLYYFRNRWYEPETGRWLSPDPIGISGGLNLYAFCGNDPVNFVDPMGLWKWDQGLIEWGIGGILGLQGRDAGISARDALGQSIKNSYLSIGDGLISFFRGDMEALEDSYDCGVFGQSVNEDPITRYGTRIAIGTASASAVIVSTLICFDMNPWLATAGFHNPHHGLGKHFEIIIREFPSGNLKIFIPGKNKWIDWK